MLVKRRSGLAPGKVEVGFKLVITAAIDAAAAEDVAGVPVGTQQQNRDAINLPSEHARPQAAVLHLPVPHSPLHNIVAIRIWFSFTTSFSQLMCKLL